MKRSRGIRGPVSGKDGCTWPVPRDLMLRRYAPLLEQPQRAEEGGAAAMGEVVGERGEAIVLEVLEQHLLFAEEMHERLALAAGGTGHGGSVDGMTECSGVGEGGDKLVLQSCLLPLDGGGSGAWPQA